MSARGSAWTSSRQRGLALVAVLWIVAALSILVTGMSYAVRGEIRLAAAARQAVFARAAGDAAIQLVLQEMVAETAKPARLIRVARVFRGQAVDVEVMPISGLIDINNAGEALLARLFMVAGRADARTAAALAQATIATRAQPGTDGRKPDPFEATEDLLRVPGIDYGLYANIAALITADQQGSGRVNPLAAPAGVLLVLADGNAANAGRIAADRDSGKEGIDTTTTLNGAYVDTAGTNRFRIQARVTMPDGKRMLISRTVDLDDGAKEGLPWRTLHTQHGIETAPTQGN